MVHPQIVKKEIEQLVSDAKSSAKMLIEGSAIPECDVFKLSYFIGDTEEARGAAAVLIKLYPEDVGTKQIWKEAVDAHSLAYKARDRFISECYCKKKT